MFNTQTLVGILTDAGYLISVGLFASLIFFQIAYEERTAILTKQVIIQILLYKQRAMWSGKQEQEGIEGE